MIKQYINELDKRFEACTTPPQLLAFISNLARDKHNARTAIANPSNPKDLVKQQIASIHKYKRLAQRKYNKDTNSGIVNNIRGILIFVNMSLSTSYNYIKNYLRRTK